MFRENVNWDRGLQTDKAFGHKNAAHFCSPTSSLLRNFIYCS